MIDVTFIQTMSGLINRFRKTLRVLLRQDERMKKLQYLGLRNSKLYTSDTLLYDAGKRIILDIRDNFVSEEHGSYYRYDGLKEFADHLENYLDQFDRRDQMVIHKSQVAAQSLLKAIQLLSTNGERHIALDIVSEIRKCVHVVASYGTETQQKLLQECLTKNMQQHRCTTQNETSSLLGCMPVNHHFYHSIASDYQRYLLEEG